MKLVFCSVLLSTVFLVQSSTSSEEWNYWIACHIEAHSVIKHVAELHKSLLKVDPLFEEHFQTLKTLHVAMDFLILNNTNLEVAKEALHVAANDSFEAFGPLTIEFNRIESWWDTNLVALPSRKTAILLDHYHKKIQEVFQLYDLEPSTSWLYTPHMTLADISGPDFDELKHKWDFVVSNSTYLGKAKIKKLQLLGWDIDPETGYYPVIEEAYFFK